MKIQTKTVIAGHGASMSTTGTTATIAVKKRKNDVFLMTKTMTKNCR